jgi:cbb3-type cytochrome oxidase maturation protein
MLGSLLLLVPLSVVLVLALLGLLAWCVESGQFDNLDAEGERILHEPDNEAPLAPPKA